MCLVRQTKNNFHTNACACTFDTYIFITQGEKAPFITIHRIVNRRRGHKKTFCIIFLSLSVVAVIMELFCCYFFLFGVLNTFVVCSVMIFFYYYLGARFFKRAFINPYISFGSAFLELILALISNLRISLSLSRPNKSLTLPLFCCAQRIFIQKMWFELH